MKKNIVKLNLDRERNLYFNLNSLELIEQLTGKPISQMNENLDMKSLKAVIYAGLIHEDSSLTLEDVGEIVGFENISEVSAAIGKAFTGLK